MSKLDELWGRQKAFNDKLKEMKPASQEYWAKQYLLGIAGEIGEILDEIVWKDHRKQTQPININNVGRELADLFKYTMCLYQLYGYSVDDMLRTVEEKTYEVETRLRNEFSPAATNGQLVIISDIDGTLGDWRSSFIDWFKQSPEGKEWIELNGDLSKDTYSTLSLETDIGLPYSVYQRAKERFEDSGGYMTLKSFLSSLFTLQTLAGNGAVIYVYTARPQNQFTRVWMDTIKWLDMVGLGEIVREVKIGGETRIDFAVGLTIAGCQVIMLEDDPTIAMRAAHTGIQVWLRDYPYNQLAVHKNIHRVPQFLASEILKEVKHGA